MTPTDRAPVDINALDAVLAPLGNSRMLPAACYTSEAVAAWEREHLFEGGWVCVGRAESVPGPGDQRASRVGRTGVLLCRDDDDVLHVFANVCRHRGHELLPCDAQASRPAVQCPYHAWRYDLKGALVQAPRVAGVANFVPGDLGLVALRHAEWAGWIFVNVSGTAADLTEHVGALAGLLEPYDPGSLVLAATHRYEVAANWKLVHENYHECYHCPQIHPELCRVTAPTSGQNFAAGQGGWVGGTMALAPGAATMSFDGRSHASPLPGLDAARRRVVLYAGLFPNLLVSAHPDYVLTHRLDPVSAGRVAVECQWLFSPEAVDEPGFDAGYAVDFWDLTNRQDWAAVESVQRGATSPAYVPGILALQEDAVHQFVTMAARAYLGAPLSASGRVEAQR
jgi:glycine betaine catabolism A